MRIHLQITHLFVKCMHVSNTCNTDFRLFIVLGDELLITCIIYFALYLGHAYVSCVLNMNERFHNINFHRCACNIHQSIQQSKVNILSHITMALEVQEANDIRFSKSLQLQTYFLVQTHAKKIHNSCSIDLFSLK